MSKLIKIDFCHECSNHIFDDNSIMERWGKHWCMLENRECEVNIPDWCKLPDAQPVPGTVVSAIEAFLKFGNETKGDCHNGYYADGGWPHNILKRFLADAQPVRDACTCHPHDKVYFGCRCNNDEKG